MNLEQQVCELGYAEELRELGVKQVSYFYHHWYKKNRDYERIETYIKGEKPEEFDDGKWKLKVYSAYTASELLGLLPIGIENSNLTIFAVSCLKDKDIEKYWRVGYRDYPHEYIHDFCDFNLANALAKMLIYLIEQKLMELPE